MPRFPSKAGQVTQQQLVGDRKCKCEESDGFSFCDDDDPVTGGDDVAEIRVKIKRPTEPSSHAVGRKTDREEPQSKLFPLDYTPR